MRRLLSHIVTTMVLLLSAFRSYGSDSLTVRRLHHDVTVAASAGYNLPSHGFYNGYNPLRKPITANSSLHLEYSFGLTDATALGRLYPGVTQGLGLSALTFYCHELMGSPVGVYIFQNASIYEFKPGLSLDYSWRLGASCGWRRNDIVATPFNISVNIGLLLSWDISPEWTLGFGPEFTHYSNGDTSYPNGGANLMNLRVGLTGHVVENTSSNDRREIMKYESELREKSFSDRLHYDLLLTGGWRAGKVYRDIYAVVNRPFPCFGLNFMPMYRLSRNFSVGASLDLLADRSADLYDIVFEENSKNVISYSQPPLYKQIAAGLSLRGDITMPIFTVGAGVGAFVPGTSHSLRGLYTVFTLKAFLNERLFLNVTYRLSSLNYTHNLMYGLGWRFN